MAWLMMGDLQADDTYDTTFVGWERSCSSSSQSISNRVRLKVGRKLHMPYCGAERKKQTMASRKVFGKTLSSINDTPLFCFCLRPSPHTPSYCRKYTL